MVTNLLKNAIQASEHQRKPEIKVFLRDHTDFITIEVKDNGTGIPDRNKSRIFEPKFTTKTSGMGLGLGIIKQIIEFYQGSIHFESNEQQGTSFYVNIPKAN